MLGAIAVPIIRVPAVPSVRINRTAGAVTLLSPGPVPFIIRLFRALTFWQILTISNRALITVTRISLANQRIRGPQVPGRLLFNTIRPELPAGQLRAD